MHVTPTYTEDVVESRKESGFNNYDFDFDAHGLRFDGKCVIQFNLPGYEITRIRTGQYILEGDEFTNIWIAEALIGQE